MRWLELIHLVTYRVPTDTQLLDPECMDLVNSSLLASRLVFPPTARVFCSIMAGTVPRSQRVWQPEMAEDMGIK